MQAGGLEPESIASALVFLISLLVGTVAIYVGAQLFVDRDTGYGRAALAAFVGAIVHTVVGLFFGCISLLGPLVMLLAWIGVINWQYPGGWLIAGGIGFVAWTVAVAILFLLARVGFLTPDALGVPNT